MKPILLLNALLLTTGALANPCGSGGMYDQQGGVCHYSDGYGAPNSPRGGNTTQPPQDYWGALAIDTINGKGSGSAQDHTSRQSAEQRAIEMCAQGPNCRVAVSYKNSCGAVASNGVKGKIHVGASDPNPTQAERKALAMCNKKSDIPCGLWIKAKCSGVGY